MGMILPFRLSTDPEISEYINDKGSLKRGCLCHLARLKKNAERKNKAVASKSFYSLHSNTRFHCPRY